MIQFEWASELVERFGKIIEYVKSKLINRMEKLAKNNKTYSKQNRCVELAARFPRRSSRNKHFIYENPYKHACETYLRIVFFIFEKPHRSLHIVFLWPVKIIVFGWTIIYRRFRWRIIIIFSASFGYSSAVREFVHFRFENSWCLMCRCSSVA